MFTKSLTLSLPVLGLTTAAAFAGSLSPQITEPPVAVAAPPASIGSYYGSLSFGAIQPDGEFTQLDISEPAYESGEIDLASGAGFLGALGYDYGNGLRVELELARLVADSDRIFFPDATAPFNEADTDGDLTITTGMVNGWYNVGSYGNLQPFVGGGIGMAKGEIDVAFDLGGNNGISDSDSVFAWQLGGGVEYAMSENVSLVASYRYLQANGLELVDNEGTDIDADLSTHVLALGATYRF